MQPIPSAGDAAVRFVAKGRPRDAARLAPAKIYVEPTTRCNMRCSMCVKYAPGSAIPERDLPFDVFRSLLPALSEARSLILSGIGEPLLHPELPVMVALARQAMPEGADIGLQTNGLLLTDECCRDLVTAGLSTVCVSVDFVAEAADASLHGGVSLPRLQASLARLRRLGHALGRPLRLGVQTVLLRDNYLQLPEVVRFAGRLGLDFVLASHMLPYGPEAVGQSLANPNTGEATALYEAARDRAAARGLDIKQHFKILHKYLRSEEDRQTLAIVRELEHEAARHGVWLNLKHLFAWDGDPVTPRLAAAMAEARAEAERLGLALELPPLYAADTRRCEFVEEDALFVDHDGAVAPCHFLWHRYACRFFDVEKLVHPVIFGSVADSPLTDIWNSPQYQAFRSEAGAYDYPDCTGCGGHPCAEVTGHRGPFEADCLAGTVPCGHCPWPTGMLRCLG